LDTEHLTDKAKAALLTLYRLGGGHSGAMVPHESLAAALGWPLAETVAQLGIIPLTYAVDGYRASRLTAEGRALAVLLLTEKPLNR